MVLVANEAAKELRRFGTGKEKVDLTNLVLGIVEDGGKELRGLNGAHVGAGENKVRDGSNLRYAFGGLLGLFHSLDGQIAFRVGGALGVLAVNGDSVAHDVQLHDGNSFQNSLCRSSPARGPAPRRQRA